jgi:hypothetical protein
MKNKKIAAAAMGAALLGGAGLTSLMTSTAGAADTSTDSSAAATGSATKAKPGQWMADALEQLVTAGTLTQAQADAVTTALEAARPEGGPGGGGPGRGRGGPGLTVAAKALGVSAADLRTALQSGKTIADVASTRNVDLQTVIDAIVASEKEHLAQAVTAGKLTQAEADERAANASERATNMVNGVRPERPADAEAPASS